MLARIKETDESVPYRHHGWWYYTREVEGLQYPIYCRRQGSMEAPEEVMLDVNELASGQGLHRRRFLGGEPATATTSPTAPISPATASTRST